MDQKFKIGDKITRHPEFLRDGWFYTFCYEQNLSLTTVFTVVTARGTVMLETQGKQFYYSKFNMERFVLTIDPNQSVGDYA